MHHLDSFLNVGSHCWNQGDLAGAKLNFANAVKAAPDSELASKSLFHVLWDLGELEEAMSEVKRFYLTTGSDCYSEIVREINEKM